MFPRIVKRDRAIEMGSRFCDVPAMQQGQAHEAMPYHKRSGGILLLRERQELSGKLKRNLAVELDKLRDPQAVKDGEQQQRIFRGLSERARLFHQRARPLDRGSGFWRRVAPDMQERGYELHVKFDLIAAQRGRA